MKLNITSLCNKDDDIINQLEHTHYYVEESNGNVVPVADWGYYCWLKYMGL